MRTLRKVNQDKLKELVLELENLRDYLDDLIDDIQNRNNDVDFIEDEIDYLESYLGVELNHGHVVDTIDLLEPFPSELKSLLINLESYFFGPRDKKELEDNLKELFKMYINHINERYNEN